ncbi:MAG: outer membrane beta-barrel protein [Bacteroidota bacterium]
MKRILILIITLASLVVHGQGTNPIKKVLLGFNFSPDYSFRTLKNNDGSPSSDIVIKSRNDIEMSKFGYTTGVNVIFNFTHLIGLETGIQYSNKGYKTKNQDLVYFPPDPGLPTQVNMTYAYNYIGIPMKAKFTLGKNKFHFLASTGFMTNFLLNVKQTSSKKYSDGKTEKKTESSSSGFNKVEIAPMMSVGVGYTISNKIYLIAEPTYRFGVLKIRDTPVAEKLWNVGLNIGIYYGLK